MMADDVGWSNASIYNLGLMGYLWVYCALSTSGDFHVPLSSSSFGR